MDELKFLWSDLPASASMRSVIEGLSCATLPLPFALDHVNVWLLEHDSGTIVIDTGLDNRSTRQHWQQLISAHNLSISRLLVTHYHPDHIGLAGWFAQQFDADILSSRREWDAAIAAMNAEDANFTDQQDQWFGLHGLDRERRDQFIKAGNTYRPWVHALPNSYSAVESGDSFLSSNGAWTVHTVGGHAVDMVCLHNPDQNVLIAADHVLPSVSPNISLHFYHGNSNPMSAYLESLKRFKMFDPDILVLPSHGLPFTGLHQRIATLEYHHETRFELLLEHCKTPSTAVDALPILFRRSLGFEQLMFAIGESVAHLHYLAGIGELQCDERSGQRLYHR